MNNLNKLILILLLCIFYSCRLKTYSFDSDVESAEMKKVFKKVLGDEYDLKYCLLAKHKSKLHKCETSFEGRVKYELTTPENCIGITVGYHYFNLYTFENNIDSVITIILSSRTTGMDGKTIGPSYFLLGNKDKYNAQESMNFSCKYAHQNKKEMVKDKVNIVIFYTGSFYSEIEVFEVFDIDKNHINNGPISFNLKGMIGSNIKFKPY